MYIVHTSIHAKAYRHSSYFRIHVLAGGDGGKGVEGGER